MYSYVSPHAAKRCGCSRSIQLAIKRVFDVLIAALALLVLSPLLLLLALLVKLESPGPVIFRQQRLGRFARTFTMYKFRSMRQDAPVLYNADGSTCVLKHDPRVTRLGTFLRRSGLDELPQLFNILRGDMSLVGPRPDPAFYIHQYRHADYRKLDMRPGLTALAHVLGRQTIGWRERFPIEQRYVECYSLWLDLKIMLATPLVIISGVGVYNQSSPTALANIPDHPWFRSMLHSRSCCCFNPLRSRSMHHYIPHRFALSVARSLLLVLILALPMTTLAAPGPTAQVIKISPILECVRVHGDGSYTAYFGYYNRNDFAVELPIGSENSFVPAPADRGQPTVFLPGRHYKAFYFFVLADEARRGGNLVWRLNGKTATVSARSTGCSHEVTLPSDFDGVDSTGAPGSIDLVWRNQLSGANSFWLMDGSSRLVQEPINTVEDLDWRMVDFNDYDADGHADIFWRHAETGDNSLWLMDVANRIGVVRLNTVDDVNWHVIGLSDFNGDGSKDILWRHAESGLNIIWNMGGYGSTRLGLDGLNSVSDTNWHMIGLQDFDGDGYNDILWRHAETGDNVFWFMQGMTRLRVYGTNRVSDMAWQLVGTGDFDGNGTADILWRNRETGANAIWLMNGSELQEMVALNTVSDQDWQMVSINDYDQDGRADIVWRNRRSGAGSLWCIDGTTRKAVVSLNTVAEAGWTVIGTGMPPVEDMAAGQAGPAAWDGAMIAAMPMVEEPPAELMELEGISSVMPDEPVSAIPMTMGLSRIYLPLVRN